MTLGMVAVGSIAVTGGIFNLRENLLKSEITIMREVELVQAPDIKKLSQEFTVKSVTEIVALNYLQIKE